MLRRKPLALTAAVVVAALLLVTAGWFLTHRRPAATHKEAAIRPKPEAPPDLEKLRGDFTSGLEALERKDGGDAVKHFGGFTFKQRRVEEYRLWYLARGHELAGDAAGVRTTLARLWQRSPRLVYRDDAGLKLARAYADAGDWRGAADVFGDIATTSPAPANTAAARWAYIESRFAQGDIASMLFAARNIVIKSPKAAEAAPAIALVRALSGQAPNTALRMTREERLERAVGLLRDGDAQDAFDELTMLEANGGLPETLRQPVQLNRGLALNQLRRFEDSNKVLEPLTSGPFRFAIPALYTAAKNYRTLAASINPIVIKTVVEKKQVGTIKTRKGKGKKARVITRPKFANVSRNVQLVDLAKKSKKETYERLAVERLKDLLPLPLADEVRIEVLNALIALAESKNQDEYERELIGKLVKIDPAADIGLQHFWDKAWAAYARGDLNGARPLFRFITDTYRSPNVRRQSLYWFARAGERLGQKNEAMAIYRQLANAPYDDLYALHSEQRGAPRPNRPENPMTAQREDWREIAEKQMPDELRLAYELTALNDMRDARAEIQRNANRKNSHYADALLAEVLSAENNVLDMYTTLRRAWPTLATVEQDSVPPYFLKLYYPMKYQETIRANAEKNGVDPYTIMALILQESYYNPRAKSGVGATGLMQLMPATGREIAQKLHTSANLENPETNIKLGAYYFKHLVDLFGGHAQLAIASYNAGQGNVMKWRRAAPGKPMDEFLESIPFPETRNYVKRVTLISSAYRRFNS